VEVILADQTASDDFSPEETVRRRDAALRRALNTPPQPKHGKVKESNPARSASRAKRGKRGQVAEAS
jgi:hypothetical protein